MHQLETSMGLEFNIHRLLETKFISSKCSVIVKLDIAPTQHPLLAKNRIRAMKAWVEDYINDAVMFSVSTDVDTTIFEQISNNIVMAPEEPHDYLLLILIHSKLLAFAGDDIIIHKTRLTTNTGEGFSSAISGDTSDWLPNMTDWVGSRHFHKKPWWNRADSSTIDLKPNEDDDLLNVPALGIDLIAEFALEDDDQRNTSSSHIVDTDQNNVHNIAEVIKPVFKPRIISNDD